PPSAEAPSCVAALFVRLALPLAALLFNDTAAFGTFVYPSVIVPFAAEVVNDDVPPTVSAPVCDRLPVESTTTRLPPIPEVASTEIGSAVSREVPFAPLVFTDTAPARRSVRLSVVVPLDA